MYTKMGAVEGEDPYFDGVISDKAAGLYGSFYSLGMIIAPIIGSEIYQGVNDNWNLTCDIFAFFAAGFCLIFFLFNVLPDIMKDRKEKAELASKNEMVKQVRETMNQANKQKRPLIHIEESANLSDNFSGSKYNNNSTKEKNNHNTTSALFLSSKNNFSNG